MAPGRLPPTQPPHPTLRSLLEARAAELGAAPFITLPDATLTYAGTDGLANRVADVLTGLGYGTGDIVMVRAANCWATVAVWFACNKLGAVFLPLNALLTGEPLRQVMAHSRGNILVVASESVADVEKVRTGLPELRHVVVVGGDRSGSAAPRLEDLIEEASSDAPFPLADDPGAPTKLMYTSGTTGVPKGVVWSRHCEALWAHCYGEELLPIDRGEALYSCLPLFHATCQATVLSALARGGRVTVDDGFNLMGFWRRVRETDAVMFTFVGTILSALARRSPHPTELDNPVRRALGSGAPLDRWQQVQDRFGLQIVDVWGQTETASCWTWPARGLPQQPGTVGWPSDRWEARIVGPDGETRSAGQAGELWIRPHEAHVMFEGYLGAKGLAEPTRESWDEDGWYHTGDALEWTDGDGLRFIGRYRDAIRRGGEMIAPSFVEEAAVGHTDVVEAAAVGVPADDGVEEEILLCVVPAVGASLDPEQLATFLAGVLPKYLVPRWLRVLPELPKTPTTRVRKFQLQSMGTAGAWDTRRRRWTPPGGG